MMRSAITHHLPNDTQLVPERWFPAPTPVPKLDGMSHGMEYTVGQFVWAALAVSCANFLCPSSFLVGWAWEAEKSLTRLNTT